eukprot:gnl/TRDRNA2_/TRDRNA2_174584_c0_seq8.p1 gnl/TRDRNA2_/TRDRNA2_174584_c0~~gnl/TRDRNA2_/TRDRNA2_174584_c0_seq8.p1  ORF type:complete len:288 (+),score=57.81 gnl/TRDRNA2_/TRDRNA2_174584_c0_seq8:49-912(+)
MKVDLARRLKIPPEAAEALLVHTCGPFALDRIVATVVEGTRTFSDEISAATDKHWEAALREKPKMFDGPVWCLVSHSVREGTSEEELLLSLQLSSFKYVLYTHLSDDGRQLSPDLRVGACGLMALTETSDGFFVFGKRSMKLGSMPGYWHCVPAGQVDSANIAAVLEKELLEETGVAWDLVADSRLLALMDSGAEQGHKYEFTFWLRLTVAALDVHERYKSAEDRAEHEAFIFVRSPSRRSTEGPGGQDAVTIGQVELEEFLGGSYQLTDVSRRGLQLYALLADAAV